MSKIEWLDEPETHNYPASWSYLNLIYSDKICDKIVEGLKASKIRLFKSKDILRASGLELLPTANHHVQKNLEKINGDKKLSPILLVRDLEHGKVIVGDGYHRLCAVYNLDEDAEIPCKIV